MPAMTVPLPSLSTLLVHNWKVGSALPVSEPPRLLRPTIRPSLAAVLAAAGFSLSPKLNYPFANSSAASPVTPFRPPSASLTPPPLLTNPSTFNHTHIRSRRRLGPRSIGRTISGRMFPATRNTVPKAPVVGYPTRLFDTKRPPLFYKRIRQTRPKFLHDIGAPSSAATTVSRSVRT